MCMERNNKETYINLKFSGQSKKAQNKKMLEKWRNLEKGVPVNPS